MFTASISQLIDTDILKRICKVIIIFIGNANQLAKIT